MKKGDFHTIKIACDGTRCPDNNYVVHPEIIGNGDIQVGIWGEAPFVDEVAEERPFIGSSGSILRDNYFDLESCTYCIFNTVSCLTYRDGETRKPSQMDYDEYQLRFVKCRPFREQMLDMLEDGSVVVVFGRFAIAGLFDDPAKKASVYPEFIEHKGKTFISYACYHPAYILYRPSALTVFDDILAASGVFRRPEMVEF